MIGKSTHEQGVKRERTGAVEVIAALRMDGCDEPRSTLEPQREEALDMGCSRGRLAITLADRTQLRQPLGTASGRMSEHAIAAIPEREAAVDRLFESHGYVAPKKPMWAGYSRGCSSASYAALRSHTIAVVSVPPETRVFPVRRDG